MAPNLLCKYYVSGCCAFGDACRFSHDRRDAPSQACKYYLAGHCSYGGECRYDHVRPENARRPKEAAAASSSGAANSSHRPPSGGRPHGSADASDAAPPRAGGTAVLGAASGGGGGGGSCTAGSSAGIYKLPSGADELGMIESSDPNPNEPEALRWVESGAAAAYVGATGYGDSLLEGYGKAVGFGSALGVEGAAHGGGSSSKAACGDGGAGGPAAFPGTAAFSGWECSAAAGFKAAVDGGGYGADDVVDPADLPLCREYADAGTCTLGEDCPLVHGDVCEGCGTYALHPYRQQAAAEHMALCRRGRQRQDRLAQDRQLECGICLERVLEKPNSSQRRFGLMSCDHPFCLGCIRSWRATDDVDVDTALRTCPVCRTTTHFITPSSTWPHTLEEKEGILAVYKAKMAAIDCVHFDYGDGICPFGTSCFYRHAHRDGRLAAAPELRRAANEEGEVRVLRPVSLSSYFDTPAAQRLLAAAPRRRLAQRLH